MSKTDLATYQFQLGQVEEALVKDPENADLLKLKSDLIELVNLYTTLVSQEESKGTMESKESKGTMAAKSIKSAATAKKPEKEKESKTELKEQKELVVGHVEEIKPKKKYVPKKEKKPSKRDLEFNQKQADWQSFNSKKPKLAQKKASFTKDKS